MGVMHLHSKSAPCKDCPDRSPGCHGTCESYKAYQAERQREYESRLQQLMAEPIGRHYKEKGQR